MFQHTLDPVLLQLGPVAIRWYGVMYLVSFVIAYLFMRRAQTFKKLGLPLDAPETLLFYLILGVILGGRLGYIIFYEPFYYLAHPLEIFSVWEGGMSFHGGLIGVAFALHRFAKKMHRSLWDIADAIVPIAPIGLFFGRIGNLINGELYGRITQSPICVYFPSDPQNCRYPSQLFEAFFEGLVLFVVLFIIARRAKKRGTVSAAFLFFYGIFRFVIEFFREADPQIGYYLGLLTQGQLLSAAMMILAIILFWKVVRSPRVA